MTDIAPRSADIVMRLDRLGASHPTRLSFLRALMRQAEREQWQIWPSTWQINDEGYGHAVIQVNMPRRSYSLVAFSTPLEDSRRTDRVIADAWDTSYVLYDGVPDEAEIERLAENAPLQEAGRFAACDLILSRANKSVRLFEHVVDSLADGRQPNAELLESVGYLMRTTAVYGNGKFGIADRDLIFNRPEFAGPFRAEMLTVWLIRSFTVALAEYVAARRSPERAVKLTPAIRRALGVGNSTGLGMAPFLVRHPILMHHWFAAREKALARVRSLVAADRQAIAGFMTALSAMRENLRRWRTEDEGQLAANVRLTNDLDLLEHNAPEILRINTRPWDALYRFADSKLSLEGTEATVALLLEPYGALVDDLADTMTADEGPASRIDGEMNCGALKALIATHYSWAAYDFDDPQANARFWYVSEEKLEPRLGERQFEVGAELEQPLAIARDVARLACALSEEAEHISVAAFLLQYPEWRHLVRRVQMAERYQYSEIHGNLIDASIRPVDLLRCKLAFFGASRFDPRSDRWLRISLFAGALFPEEICAPNELQAAS